jgi:hypothetical protein
MRVNTYAASGWPRLHDAWCLKRNAWYYGARCRCGRRIVVAADCTNGHDNDLLELAKPLAVECECSAVINRQSFQKFKTLSLSGW